MLYKEMQAKSLLDYILDVMPELEVIHLRRTRGLGVNNAAAKKLFALWKDEKNKDAQFLLRRPTTISAADVDLMQREGLVKNEGDKLKITSKGAEIIKTMILGNDKSAFEDDGKILDYQTAFANTKPKRMKIGRKCASKNFINNWYHRSVGE